MQSFHANNLKQYLRVFNEQANGLINRLKIHVGQGDFNIHNELSLCTMYSLLGEYSSCIVLFIIIK